MPHETHLLEAEPRHLPDITLVAIDCINAERAKKALDISSAAIKFADVKLLTSLPADDSRKVDIPHLGSAEAHSEFCIRNLVNYIDTDFVLLVQHDGFILNPDSWENDFLQYDYIGGPWVIQENFWFDKVNFPQELKNTKVVGNGGFSLRSRKFLTISKQLADNELFEAYHPEDVALCVWKRTVLEDAGIHFAPAEKAEQFSIEGPHYTYNKQFGFHGFQWTNISKWIQSNPHWNINTEGRRA